MAETSKKTRQNGETKSNIKKIIPNNLSAMTLSFVKSVWTLETQHRQFSPQFGRAKGDAPKVTKPNLRFPAVSCENLRFSAPSKCLNFQEKGWICENLRFSAKICVLGSLSVTLVPSPQARPDTTSLSGAVPRAFFPTSVDDWTSIMDSKAFVCRCEPSSTPMSLKTAPHCETTKRQTRRPVQGGFRAKSTIWVNYSSVKAVLHLLRSLVAVFKHIFCNVQ